MGHWRNVLRFIIITNNNSLFRQKETTLCQKVMGFQNIKEAMSKLCVAHFMYT